MKFYLTRYYRLSPACIVCLWMLLAPVEAQRLTVEDWHRDSGANPTRSPFTTLAAGDLHTCGLRRQGNVQCWGDDRVGQANPPQHQTFTSIAAGEYHTCGLRIDSSVHCWGLNTHGQSSPPQHQIFESITAGNYHTCGLRHDGSVRCWRANAHGQARPPVSEVVRGGPLWQGLRRR